MTLEWGSRPIKDLDEDGKNKGKSLLKVDS